MQAVNYAPEASVHQTALPSRPTGVDLVAGALLVATVVLHVVAMFPSYLVFPGQSPSIFAQPDQAGLFFVLAGGWALALAVGLSGPARLPLCAGLATGIAVTELGFRVSDLGWVFRYGGSAGGAGLWLMTAAWVVGAGAAIAALVAARRRSTRMASGTAATAALVDPTAPVDRTIWTIGVAILGLAVAGAFLPGWDHYYGASSVTGRAVSFNLGDAWNAPWQVVVGSFVAAVVFIAVPVVAVRLRNRTAGAAAAVGGLIVLLSQLISAVIQVDQPVSPNLAGLSATRAAQLGFALNINLTGWFTLDALAAFAMFAAMMVWATGRPVYANSPGTLPSAPEARSEAMRSTS
jgi:hypothetical protein